MLGVGQSGEAGGSSSVGGHKVVNPGVKGGEAVLERSTPSLKRCNSFTEGSVRLGGKTGKEAVEEPRRRRWAGPGDEHSRATR